MASDSSPGPAVSQQGEDVPRPGTRVWLLQDGRFGRVVAVAQGGLVCRVRPEGAGPTSLVACARDELFVLHAGEG